MEYVPFLKQRYANPDYEKKYQEVFANPDTIHLNFLIGENEAFIAPVSELYQLVIEIHRLDKDVRSLCFKLPEVALTQFARRCLVDEIVISNDIEGVSSTRREISDAIEQVDEKKAKRFYGLANKYIMLQKREDISLNGCMDIRELYNDLVLKEVVDEEPKNNPDGQIFRKESVSVSSRTEKEIHRGVYPESKIISCMENALLFLNDNSQDSLIRISAFHYLFGYIHPFYDGNGRTSRFISSYLLSRELTPLIGYRLSYTIKENLNKYYGAFKICNDSKNLGDMTPFVITFLEIVKEAMGQLRKALAERNKSLEHYRERISSNSDLCSQKHRQLADLLLQAALFAENGISTQDLMKNIEISRTSLKKWLNEIDEYVMSQKVGREIYYKLNLEKLS